MRKPWPCPGVPAPPTGKLGFTVLARLQSWQVVSCWTEAVMSSSSPPSSASWFPAAPVAVVAGLAGRSTLSLSSVVLVQRTHTIRWGPIEGNLCVTTDPCLAHGSLIMAIGRYMPEVTRSQVPDRTGGGSARVLVWECPGPSRPRRVREQYMHTSDSPRRACM